MNAILIMHCLSLTCKQKDYGKTHFLLCKHLRCHEKSKSHGKRFDLQNKKAKTPINLVNINDLDHIQPADDEISNNNSNQQLLNIILIIDYYLHWDNRTVIMQSPPSHAYF